MADAPLLFGKGPTVNRACMCQWDCAPWQAQLFELPDGFAAVAWLDAHEHFHEEFDTEASALRALERELTRLAAGLDAMGVPRG